ncbi:MAG: hypothetical protein ACXWFY_01985 [Chthoniobacterales bacterium]
MKTRTWLIVALCATLLMPSNDSVWIDEAQTAAYARQPTASTWFERLQHDKFSEAQMPLGMAVFWISGKILGTGEWQLRAINILFTTTTIWMLWLIGCRFCAPALALVAAANPFLWAYTNEARPYALQIAGGACLLLAGVKLIHGERDSIGATYLWSIAVLVLCASSMLGVIPAAIGSLWLALLLLRRRLSLSLHSLGVIATVGGLLLLLGYYYLRTLQRGASGAMLWPVSLNNLAFSAYEILGFAGLGPARQTLRDAFTNGTVLSTTLPFLFPLALFGAATLLIAFHSVRWFWRRENHALGFFLYGIPALSAALLFLLARLVHFPFWGRHLAPITPFIIVALALPALIEKKRIFTIFWTSLCLLSALELRFVPRHAKDDNRAAAQLALRAAAEGKKVWWSADQRAAEYYGITFGNRISLAPQLPSEAPDIVITSKPDVFDVEARVAEYLRIHDYQKEQTFQAMTVWRR